MQGIKSVMLAVGNQWVGAGERKDKHSQCGAMQIA